MLASSIPKKIQNTLLPPYDGTSSETEPRFTMGIVMTRAEIERNEWLDK